jgi:hypothetical protein
MKREYEANSQRGSLDIVPQSPVPVADKIIAECIKVAKPILPKVKYQIVP